MILVFVPNNINKLKFDVELENYSRQDEYGGREWFEKNVIPKL